MAAVVVVAMSLSTAAAAAVGDGRTFHLHYRPASDALLIWMEVGIWRSFSWSTGALHRKAYLRRRRDAFINPLVYAVDNDHVVGAGGMIEVTKTGGRALGMVSNKRPLPATLTSLNKSRASIMAVISTPICTPVDSPVDACDASRC